MTIIYVITRGLTFFGTVLRALWEQIVCRLCKIAEEDVKPFKMSELCGHVEHEIITKVSHSFLMCFLPFALNFLLSCCFLAASAYPIFYVGLAPDFQTIVFLWLGISFAANCAPSFEDMLMFKDALYGGENKALKIILSPFFAICCGCACLEKYSLTFILSVIWAIVFPTLTSFLI